MNPQENFMQLRIAPWALAVLAWLLVLGAGNWLFSEARPQEISRLQVEGDFKRVSAREVEARVRERLQQGFVELALNDVKTDIEAMPWVARARVERLWPAGIRVRIWEREPYARWGKDSMVDTQGGVFTPKPAEISASLPLLSGGKGHELEVMHAFEALGSGLRGTPFEIGALTLDARGEWSAQTLSGIGLRLGQSAPEGKLESLRGAVLTTLASRINDVDYIDLRYTNGFAVGWKPQTKQVPQAALGEQHG